MTLVTTVAPARDTDPGPGWVLASAPMLGGRVSVALDATVEEPEARARRALDRLGAWAARLTRFDAASELSRLNADPRAAVPVGPTLAAVLDWARDAGSATDGLVDVTLLDARLAAEHGTALHVPTCRAWSLERGRRGSLVRRPAGVRFDLDGVAKGWLADRVLGCLPPDRSAIIDADGDVAVRLGPGGRCSIGVADPRTRDGRLAVIELVATTTPAVFGVATSGTSVHRWEGPAGPAHHLIDPTTGRPARTDLAQVTVVAERAAMAEAWAKALVIAGLGRGRALLDRSGVVGAVLLTESGEITVSGSLQAWLG